MEKDRYCSALNSQIFLCDLRDLCGEEIELGSTPRRRHQIELVDQLPCSESLFREASSGDISFHEMIRDEVAIPGRTM